MTEKIFPTVFKPFVPDISSPVESNEKDI